MVQFFVGPQSQTALSNAMIGEGLGKGLGQVAQRGLLQGYLQQAQQAAQSAQTPLQQAFALMQAGAAIPGSERYLATLLPLLMQQSQTQGLQNANLTGKAALQQQRMPQEPVAQIQQLPGFMGQQGQDNPYYPNILGGREAIGNIPLPSTQKVPKPVMSGDELAESAQKLSKQVPGLTYDKALEIESQKNAANEAYNKTIKQELAEKKEAQRDYGAYAAKLTQSMIPDASPEISAMTQKWAEEAGGSNQSEADIKREISAKVTQFRNQLSSLQKTIPPGRTQNLLQQQAKGNARSFDQAKNDIRAKLGFLLKNGLYDTARSMLSERGYYPEETEMILSDLSEPVNKTLAKMPKIENIPARTEQKSLGGLKIPYTEAIPEQIPPQKIDAFKQNITEALKADPKANLLLLRRAYELEKNIDWRTFKDALNDAQLSGQWEPTDDQIKQLNMLEGPPLGPLDKLLHGLGIIGR